MATLNLSDGTSLYYRESGPRSPFSVVFLHGFACTGRDWEPTANALSDRYHTVILDFRGHDRSNNVSDGNSLALLADDLQALLGHLNLARPVLVGHSMGGMVALEYALRHPGNLRALVLAEAFPHLATVSAVFGPPEDPINDPYGYGSVIDHQTPPSVIEQVRRQMSAGVSRLPDSLFQSLLDFDAHRRLNSLSLPVLLLVGGRRTFQPDDGPVLVERLGYGLMPRLQLALIDSHHFVMLEQPEITIALIRAFLGTLGDRP